MYSTHNVQTSALQAPNFQRPRGLGMLIENYLTGINALIIILYAKDKLTSKGWFFSHSRLPEVYFYLLELAGGSPGAYVAQRIFNHKLSKERFQQDFFEVLLLQIAGGAAWWYWRGGSIALAGCGTVTMLMLIGTRIQICKLHKRQPKSRLPKPWQKPVSLRPVFSEQDNQRGRVTSRLRLYD